jgi:CheY-like chemotaxis protein
MRVQQVISNLLGNAVKFTPEGGRAIVVLKRDEDGSESLGQNLVIEVTDTGIGIDPQFLPYIFDRFTQAHDGIDRRFGGLGLGLAISRAIVELHGGKVSAHSEGQNRGTRLTVKLPITTSVHPNDPLHRRESVVDDREIRDLGLRVLVIEDSLDTLNMLRLWLGTFGCQVDIADDAREGVRLALEQRPDLIISDIGMPEVDGYELIRMLRATPGMQGVPAIALTGYARDEDRDLALAAGYNAHISKPANMAQLLYLINKLTRH